MRVALVGFDMAPSKAFAELANVLELPVVLLAHAKKENVPSDDDIRDLVRQADFVLCGISQPAQNAHMELIAVEEARHRQIPFGFYSDAKGAWGRDTIAKFRDDASLILTVLGGTEVVDTEVMFPNAQVVCTGNPLWEQYFVPADREKSRALCEASPDEFVVLSPGTEEPVITIQLWAAVIEAAVMMGDGRDKVVILTQHPGDQTPPEMYKLLVDYAPALDVRLVGPMKASSDDYVPGVDAVVANMNSSVAVHAISRRIGTVDFYGPLAQERLKRGGAGIYGQHYNTGAVFDIYNASPTVLASVLDMLVENPLMLEQDQETVHPPLQAGEAVQNMRRAIERVLYRT